MEEKKITTKKPSIASASAKAVADKKANVGKKATAKPAHAGGAKIIKKAEKPTAKKTQTSKAAVVQKKDPVKAAKATKSKDVFAVIETGGKQYKIESGEILIIEKLVPADKKKEFKEGDKIIFDKVLLLDDGKDTKVGTPYLSNVKIEAEFTEEGRGKKIRILRFRAKSRHHRRVGHRQPYTKVKISAIK